MKNMQICSITEQDFFVAVRKPRLRKMRVQFLLCRILEWLQRVIVTLKLLHSSLKWSQALHLHCLFIMCIPTLKGSLGHYKSHTRDGEDEVKREQLDQRSVYGTAKSETLRFTVQFLSRGAPVLLPLRTEHYALLFLAHLS